MSETLARRLTKCLWAGCFLMVVWVVMSVPPGPTECADSPVKCEGE